MRKALLPTALLIALMAWPADGFAGTQGHNPGTRKLEASFTVALSARVDSTDGCYPSEPRLAKLIKKKKKFRTMVVGGPGAVRQENVVYVLRQTTCNNVRMATRSKGQLYVLDSAKGEIRVVGRKPEPDDPVIVGNRGPLRAVSLTSKNVNVNSPNRRIRFDARCPGGKFPIGGSIFSTPGIGADGEGVYPHSYERLGTQRGWHVTGWLLDKVGEDAQRKVTVQVVCGRGLVPMSSPHKTSFTKPGETKTVTARCPGGQVLMSGGFQRTDFLDDGGNYVTESKAVGSKAWTVTGHAYGAYGGELTAIAYCVKNKGPLLTEVSGQTTPFPISTAVEATTPACPAGQRLAAGGFSANGSQDTFFAGGTIGQDNTFTARGYGFFGPAPALTAFGYCLQPGTG